MTDGPQLLSEDIRFVKPIRFKDPEEITVGFGTPVYTSRTIHPPAPPLPMKISKYPGEKMENNEVCVLPIGDSCLSDRVITLSVGSAVVAGTVAGVIGTVVGYGVLIPLTPLLSQLGLGAAGATPAVVP